MPKSHCNEIFIFLEGYNDRHVGIFDFIDDVVMLIFVFDLIIDDRTRVKLSYTDDEIGSDYINANYIHVSIIYFKES